MSRSRAERVAKNEVSFRDINERLEAGLRRVEHHPELLEFICECGNRRCEQHVRLTLDEYEQIRGDSRHFAIVPGHVAPGIERVVASTARYDVVEKIGEGAEIADAADRRNPETGGERQSGQTG